MEAGLPGVTGHRAVELVDKDPEKDNDHAHPLHHQKMERIALVLLLRLKIATKAHAPLQVRN